MRLYHGICTVIGSIGNLHNITIVPSVTALSWLGAGSIFDNIEPNGPEFLLLGFVCFTGAVITSHTAQTGFSSWCKAR